MDYKKLMGYSDTKKVTKKVSKPKVNKVLENIKSGLNEWNDRTFKNAPKRWSTDKGLTEYEKLKEVGAGAEYRKYYKDIEKKENELAKSVNIFSKVLYKKGIKNDLAHVYLKHTRMWDTYFKKLINKLM